MKLFKLIEINTGAERVWYTGGRLLSRRFQVGDQIISLFLLLQTGEDHLCSWDVFFGVGEVDFKSVFPPRHSLLDVGLRVSEAGSLSGLPAPKSPEVGPRLVFASAFDGVALGATLHKDLLALFNVSGSHFCFWPVRRKTWNEGVKTRFYDRFV